MKALIYSLLLLILISQVYALSVEVQEDTDEDDIQFVDVSADGESCIFKVHGKTVVVDRRDKATIEGVTIYVQEVYPVNNEAQDTDRCKFMYTGIAQDDQEEPVKQMTIGEKVVHFLLGKRNEAEVQSTEIIENTPKEPPEETIVKVGGYDVTQTQEVQDTSANSEEPKTFFQKLKRFLIG